jgi:hypothetical protein
MPKATEKKSKLGENESRLPLVISEKLLSESLLHFQT